MCVATKRPPKKVRPANQAVGAVRDSRYDSARRRKVVGILATGDDPVLAST